MNQYAISIIIPAYNVQSYIEDTLQAAYETADENTEIIVINDGSTDYTGKIIDDILPDLSDKSVNVIDQPNQGVSAARNAGIDASKGEYIVFCDGDDRCRPNLVKSLRGCLEDNPDSDMILWGFDSYTVNTDEYRIIQGEFGGNIIDGKTAFGSMLLGENKIRLGSFAVKKELLDRFDIRYTVGCPLSQDVEFIYKCLSRAGKVSLINEVLFTYVKRTGSVMFRYNINRFEAPRTMQRIYEYVKKNTDICEDSEINEYLRNGFYIQHLMYSFDACIPYLTDKDIRKEFWIKYYANYPDIEAEVKRIKRCIIRYPYNFNKCRTKLLLISRKAYVRILLVKNK